MGSIRLILLLVQGVKRVLGVPRAFNRGGGKQGNGGSVGATQMATAYIPCGPRPAIVPESANDASAVSHPGQAGQGPNPS